MLFHKINQDDISFFRSVMGEKHVLVDEENLERCARDQTEDLCFLPEIVLQPGTTEEVSFFVSSIKCVF